MALKKAAAQAKLFNIYLIVPWLAVALLKPIQRVKHRSG